ncbi:MAG: PBSX family phage terminase large subunit, partial [Acetanaerobacterium sp.]
GKYTVPDDPARKYTQYRISIDYGTLNPCSMGLWGLSGGVWYRFKEYYHSGRDTRRQLTDEEYYIELQRLTGDHPIRSVIIDPSAASFIAAIRKHGRFTVLPANNTVVDGIRATAAAMQAGKVRICTGCTHTIAEFSAYRWDEKAAEDRPIKESDHAMDDIRYFVYTVLGSTGLGVVRLGR